VWYKTIEMPYNATCELVPGFNPENGARCLLVTGTFGRVLECWDRLTRDYVAIKIVRNVDKYRHAAMLEVRLSMDCLCQWCHAHIYGVGHVCNALKIHIFIILTYL
jgi:hypothetical protein